MQMEIKSIVVEMKKHIRSLSYLKLDQDELLQDAMLKVLRARSFRTGFGPGWLYRVARSVVFDAHKRSVKERQYRYGYLDVCGRVCESEDDDLSGESKVIYHPTYFDRFHDVAPDDLDEIPEILSSLSFHHQEVLLLYANGLTYQEISHMTGLAIGTVRSRLHFARKHAHKLVEERRKKENEESKKSQLVWNT